MKKISILLLLIAILLLSFGCRKNEKPEEKEAGELRIEYRTYPTEGTVEEINNYRYVKVFSDKVVEWGYGSGENITNGKLSDNKYNTLIALAFSKKFTSLNEDISDKRVMDGDISYITIYYEDGSSKRIGGTNPTNETFLELERELEAIFDTDH